MNYLSDEVMPYNLSWPPKGFRKGHVSSFAYLPQMNTSDYFLLRSLRHTSDGRCVADRWDQRSRCARNTKKGVDESTGPSRFEGLRRDYCAEGGDAIEQTRRASGRGY